jgi:hypothetical protein
MKRLASMRAATSRGRLLIAALEALAQSGVSPLLGAGTVPGVPGVPAVPAVPDTVTGHRAGYIAGPPEHYGRHARARAELLRCLLDDERVTDFLSKLSRRHRLTDTAHACAQRLDAIAAAAGLPSRAALFAPRGDLALAVGLSDDAAKETIITGMDFGAEFADRRGDLALAIDGFVASHVPRPWPWIAADVRAHYLAAFESVISGRRVGWAYATRALDRPTPPLSIEAQRPGESRRAFMHRVQTAARESPKASPQDETQHRRAKKAGDHVERAVDWWYAHHVKKISIHALARQWQAEMKELRAKDSPRSRVRDAIKRAEEWLTLAVDRKTSPAPQLASSPAPARARKPGKVARRRRRR